MCTANPRFWPKVWAGVLSPAAISPAFTAANRIMLPSNTHQAMRLRAVKAAASNARTNAHAMLVSGKLNRYLLMNSRGILISQRTSGDTLATRDSVAMMPTVQPAAAGTQRYREVDWLPGRGPDRGLA